VPFRVRKLES